MWCLTPMNTTLDRCTGLSTVPTRDRAGLCGLWDPTRLHTQVFVTTPWQHATTSQQSAHIGLPHRRLRWLQPSYAALRDIHSRSAITTLLCLVSPTATPFTACARRGRRTAPSPRARLILTGAAAAHTPLSYAGCICIRAATPSSLTAGGASAIHHAAAPPRHSTPRHATRQ